MFKEAGGGIRIECDTQVRVLRVQVNHSLPGWKPLWREAATFDSFAGWVLSPYSRLVSEPEIVDEIAWFWVDLEREVSV